MKELVEIVRWADRCKVGDSCIKVMSAMEAEIKELRELATNLQALPCSEAPQFCARQVSLNSRHQ